jgi:UDP-3-O-[3-hydroxymyristoyl] glucosamine N-acyltransferase
MKKNVAELADLIKGIVHGDKKTIICGVTNYKNPLKEHITFIQEPQDLAILENSEIACLIVPKTISSNKKTCIQVDNPKKAFALLMQLFYPPRTYAQTISTKASISETASIGKNVTIEDFVYIGPYTKIGDNSTIRAFSFLDQNVTIGQNTIIHPHTVIYNKTIIGNNVIIHSSTVIGADGFGYTKNELGHLIKIPQIGNVIIEDDVEIGSNASIDRATFGSTVIKKRVKIDNLVQVAHNVTIDEDTTVSGLAGIAGSATIGKNCTIAAAVGIGDHAVLENNVTIGGKSGVASKKTIKANSFFMGLPARPFSKFREAQENLIRIPHMASAIKDLKEKLSWCEQQLKEIRSGEIEE